MLKATILTVTQIGIRFNISPSILAFVHSLHSLFTDNYLKLFCDDYLFLIKVFYRDVHAFSPLSCSIDCDHFYECDTFALSDVCLCDN
jgi:hypothetical protein